MRIAALPLALTAILSLGACATLDEAANGPKLAPMDTYAMLAQAQLANPVAGGPVTPVAYTAPAAGPNSLWRAGGRSFFNDPRAARVGDILTVEINIDDRATTNNQSTSSRTSETQSGVSNFLGLENTLGRILPGGFDPADAVNAGSSTTNAGAGSVNRAEKINLTIAAVVTHVMPNGNLYIQGSQEVRTNAELRQLNVSGMVRPEDISSANTVRHTQIAEARIAYGGRGDISRVQKTPAAQSLVERFTPF
jgi:flagellar L-ring protein precursor FlgH